MTLHILNLCTTLTPATATDRYNNHPSSRSLHVFSDPVPDPIRKVDITSPVIAEVLGSLAALEELGPVADSSERAVQKDVEVEVLVRVSPPIHVRIIREDKSNTADDIFENFMESWTRLVGDEVLSKWIVLVLAVSVALNGYLLKGIAAGSHAVRPAAPTVRFGGNDPLVTPPSSTSPLAREKVAPEHTVKVVSPPVSATLPPPALAPVSPPVAELSSLGLNLAKIDSKLEAQRIQRSSSFSSLKPSLNIRSLEECIEVFENGPRPVSVSLSMLNDEEVILLSQNGKIAAYALEKTLGDNERAVSIRRALICKSSFTSVLLFTNKPFSPCFQDQDPRVL